MDKDTTRNAKGRDDPSPPAILKPLGDDVQHIWPRRQVQQQTSCQEQAEVLNPCHGAQPSAGKNIADNRQRVVNTRSVDIQVGHKAQLVQAGGQHAMPRQLRNQI